MKRLLLSLGILSMSYSVFAQLATDYRPVTTAVPSLAITPDARAAGLGDQGVATTPDPYAQYWNPAKHAFARTRSSIALSYTPWLSQLASDIVLMQATGYYKIGDEDKHALGASLRYFSLGKTTRWDELGRSLGDARPSEWAVDVSYALKLSPEYALAVSLRYIHANQDMSGSNGSGGAFVADLSGYMHRYVPIIGREALWTAGINIKNIGSKLSLDGGTHASFIPTNLSLGTGLFYPINKHNMISISLEANKLLVPMIPYRFSGESSADYAKRLQAYRDTSSLSGIIKSLSDAPDGFAEEMREVRWSIGAEYNYDDTLYLRAGYSYLNPLKGNLQAFTAGLGFRLNAFRIDVSYMISTVQSNPLDQTLRFSMAFDIDGIRQLLR